MCKTERERKGEFGRETSGEIEEGWGTRSLPSFLARPSRLPSAQNPLSLPFWTSTTQANDIKKPFT